MLIVYIAKSDPQQADLYCTAIQVYSYASGRSGILTENPQ